jgi:hypothetical protein
VLKKENFITLTMAGVFRLRGRCPNFW